MERREGPPHCLKNLETLKQAVSWPKMVSGSLCGACQPVNILGVAGFIPLHPLPVYEESATGWRVGGRVPPSKRPVLPLPCSQGISGMFHVAGWDCVHSEGTAGPDQLAPGVRPGRGA